MCLAAKAKSDTYHSKIKKAVFDLAHSLHKSPNRFPKNKQQIGNFNIRFATVFNLEVYFEIDEWSLQVTIINLQYTKMDKK